MQFRAYALSYLPVLETDVTNARGSITAVVYNRLGNPTNISGPDVGGGGMGNWTAYAWDGQSGYRYDAYGVQTQAADPMNNPYRYTAREWDNPVSLSYHRARFYDPTLGRFLSKDPAGMVDGTNLYAYAGDNPVNYGDPSGLDGNPWSGTGTGTCARFGIGCGSSCQPGGGSGGTWNPPSPAPSNPPNAPPIQLGPTGPGPRPGGPNYGVDWSCVGRRIFSPQGTPNLLNPFQAWVCFFPCAPCWPLITGAIGTEGAAFAVPAFDILFATSCGACFACIGISVYSIIRDCIREVNSPVKGGRP